MADEVQVAHTHISNTEDYYEREASYAEWKRWWDDSGRSAYDPQRPDVTVDCVVLTYDPDACDVGDSLRFLAVRRKTHPFRGQWAIPGTYLHSDEAGAEESVARLLAWLFRDPEACHARVQQIRTFTGAGRDPRGQTASVLHVVYVSDGMAMELNGGVDARWMTLSDYDGSVDLEEAAPDDEPRPDAMDVTAFDHQAMLRLVVNRLRDQFGWTPNVFYTLPTVFTTTEAVRLRCSLYAENDVRAVNRKNFVKKYSPLWDDAGLTDPADGRPQRLWSVQGKRGMAIE